MALSMDEQRMLAEIERRLADDDPVLAARLTSFRLPRLTFATRSARSRLTASLLMLVVVGVVSVFVYALIPFRGQAVRAGGVHSTASPAHPTMSASGPGHVRAAGQSGIPVRGLARTRGPAAVSRVESTSSAYGK
jgi:hypothetical protein